VAFLLDRLREAGAREPAATLAGRLPAVGLFRLFLKRNGLADQFRFGRETDGTRPRHGAGRPGLMACSRPAGTVRRLARLPTADPPDSQGKSGQFPVRTSGATLRSPAQRSGSSQSSRGQDIANNGEEGNAIRQVSFANESEQLAAWLSHLRVLPSKLSRRGSFLARGQVDDGGAGGPGQQFGGVEAEYVDPGRGRERRLPRRRLARSLRRIAPVTASRPDAPASGPIVCPREPTAGIRES